MLQRNGKKMEKNSNGFLKNTVWKHWKQYFTNFTQTIFP